MSISTNQGYVRSFNLSETFDEFLSLNNLAGGSISEDLQVFSNNTKNVSTVVYKPGVNNFSRQETGVAGSETSLFEFDLLSIYGNGDPVKIRAARTISTMSYLAATSTEPESLSIILNENHGLTSSAEGKTIKLYDTFFTNESGIPGSEFFNNKNFIIKEVNNTTGIIVTNIKWSTLFEGGPGTFDSTNRYPYVTCNLFPLPTYIIPDTTPLVSSQFSYDETYRVVLTNGINNFKIASSYSRQELVKPFAIESPFQSSDNIDIPIIFERNNEVTNENLLNLIFPEFVDENTFLSSNDPIYNNGVLSNTINQNFSNLELSLDAANYFRFKKYARSINNIFEVNPIKLEGSLKSFDPDNFNNGTADIFTTTSPGVFIINPSSTRTNIEKLRSFSDNTSPWELNSGTSTLEYSAAAISNPDNQEMSIGNMILKGNPISVNNIQGIQTESGTVLPSQKFTHKLPVIINGEEYNLLLTDSVA